MSKASLKQLMANALSVSSKSDALELTVDVTPYPQSRPRVCRTNTYELPSVAQYKRTVRTCAVQMMNGREPLEGCIEASLIIRRNKKVDSKAFGDIDNHQKAVFDALNGVCYTDDSHIVAVHVSKQKSKLEGIDVVIKKWQGSDLP